MERTVFAQQLAKLQLAVSCYVVNREQTFVGLTLETTPCLQAALAKQPKEERCLFTQFAQFTCDNFSELIKDKAG